MIRGTSKANDLQPLETYVLRAHNRVKAWEAIELIPFNIISNFDETNCF